MTDAFGSKDMNGAWIGVIFEVLKINPLAYGVVSMSDKLDFCLSVTFFYLVLISY